MFLTRGAEDFWESFGDKEIKPVNPEGNQPSIFIERTDAEAEAPNLWPPNEKSQLLGQDPEAERLSAGEGGDKG